MKNKTNTTDNLTAKILMGIHSSNKNGVQYDFAKLSKTDIKLLELYDKEKYKFYQEWREARNQARQEIIDQVKSEYGVRSHRILTQDDPKPQEVPLDKNDTNDDEKDVDTTDTDDNQEGGSPTPAARNHNSKFKPKHRDLGDAEGEFHKRFPFSSK